jgi:predicted N-acetyltransferase YhbS
MDAPRPARPGEFRELMDFIDLVFRPNQKGRCILGSQYPHLFQDRRSYLARNIMIRDRGEIVGNISIHPVPLRLEEVILMAGGIGQVGVHPWRRREGIMTTLLNDAIERMGRQDMPISILGGDRQRYGWFGWENGGVRNLFTLTQRFVGKPTAAERRLPIKQLGVTPAIGRKMLAIDRQRAYGVVRRPGEMKPLCERRGREGWGCQVGGGFAYAILGGAGHQARAYERIDEAGGDPQLLESLIRVLMARFRRERLQVITGPNAEDVGFFRQLCGHWERSTDCMIKIIDLQLMLQVLEPLLKRRAKERGVRGGFNFTMEDSEQVGRLDLGKGRNHRLYLGDRDMVSLFFGALPVCETFGGGPPFDLLDKLLPLPLFASPLNHV